MSNTETLLLAIIAVMFAWNIYSFLYSRRCPKSRATESRAESLMHMLNQYTQRTREKKQNSDFELSSIDVQIPTKEHPKFSNLRAVDEMGLSQEEADALVLELVKAIESEIPRIEKALKTRELITLEEIVHKITGSSSTLGSGGISSALISFYTAVQHHDDMNKLQIQLENVKYYLSRLKEDRIAEDTLR
jgi:hypothetical protein